MNAATAVSAATTVPQVQGAIQEIPLSHIGPSPTNPRRRFDETKLAELAANIRQYGVLQPVLVRLAPSGAPGVSSRSVKFQNTSPRRCLSGSCNRSTTANSNRNP